MKKQKIYFARHGTTEANKIKRHMGCLIDEPLNQEGLRDVYVLAESVPRYIDVIVSSPLKRARQTADIVAGALRIPVVEDSNLKERDGGSLSGKLWSDIKVETGGVIDIEKLRSNFEIDYKTYGGESPVEVRARIQRFLARVREEWKDKVVLAVTHAGIIRVCTLLAGYSTPPRIGNCSVVELEI